jgi:hypothetical protein
VVVKVLGTILAKPFHFNLDQIAALMNIRGSWAVLFVAYRPRFGGDSQARTPQLVWTSYSDETGTRPTEFSYVYKYQLATQVDREQVHSTHLFGQILIPGRPCD